MHTHAVNMYPPDPTDLTHTRMHTGTSARSDCADSVQEVRWRMSQIVSQMFLWSCSVTQIKDTLFGQMFMDAFLAFCPHCWGKQLCASSKIHLSLPCFSSRLSVSGGFSETYAALCDYNGISCKEEVQWVRAMGLCLCWCECFWVLYAALCTKLGVIYCSK